MQGVNQASTLMLDRNLFSCTGQGVGDGAPTVTREERLVAGELEVMKQEDNWHNGNEMNERQRRTDTGTANSVARGVNIQSVRNRALAQKYMEYRRVPPGVIARVLDKPLLRRAPSTDQLVSEAITPSGAAPAPDEAGDQRG